MSRPREQVLDELRAVLREVIGAECAELELTDETSLVYDLGMESVEFVALFDALESRFGAAWRPFEIEGLQLRDLLAITLGDVVNAVQNAPDVVKESA